MGFRVRAPADIAFADKNEALDRGPAYVFKVLISPGKSLENCVEMPKVIAPAPKLICDGCH
jgi:hypothetical protein